MPTDVLEPIHLPAEFWCRSDVCAALAARDMGALFRLVRQYSGASQTRIGIAAGMAQSYVSNIVRGHRQVMAQDVFVRIAAGLHMPDAARAHLGLAPIPTPGHADEEPRDLDRPAADGARVYSMAAWRGRR